MLSIQSESLSVNGCECVIILPLMSIMVMFMFSSFAIASTIASSPLPYMIISIMRIRRLWDLYSWRSNSSAAATASGSSSGLNSAQLH